MITPRAGQLRRHTVLQGQTFVSADADIEISTVLGSCISMCLYDPTAAIGGMNHFLLAGEAQEKSQHLRYGMYAFEQLLNSMLKMGAERTRIKAKVFGGASMGGSFAELGPQNAAFALGVLKDEEIECVSQSIGGVNARRLRFYPTTGDVKMLLVPLSEAKETVPSAIAKPAAASEIF